MLVSCPLSLDHEVSHLVLIRGDVCRDDDDNNNNNNNNMFLILEQLICSEESQVNVTYRLLCYPDDLVSLVTSVSCSLLVRGYRRELTFDDLWDLKPEDKCDEVVTSFENEWKKELERTKWK